MSSDARKIVFGIVLVFGLILAYTLEVPHLQNTLAFRKLLLTALLLGILIGGGVAYFLGRNRQEILERFQLFIGMLMFGVLLMPLLLSWSNRHLTYQDPQIETLEILRIETYTTSRFGRTKDLENTKDGYRVFVLRQGEVLRLQAPQIPFPDKNKGDLVSIKICRGFWGFEFVDW